MIRQCAILFGCLALGELIVYLTGIKLPSSIIGMLLLALLRKNRTPEQLYKTIPAEKSNSSV